MSRFLREPPSVRLAAGVIVAATAVLVVISGVLMRVFDQQEYSSVGEGMWWALQTVTTVGYGDVTPKEPAGRIIAAFVMLEGIALLSITVAAITSTFVARAQREHDAADAADENQAAARVEARLDDVADRLGRLEAMLGEDTRRRP
jgi:voltage-gated potassium channel